MYRLELLTDDGPRATFPLVTGSTMSVGRHRGNDIVLDDTSVSRSHCLIYVDFNSVAIEDLASTNGVRVSGKRVTARTPLIVDEEVKIGYLRLILREVDERVSTTETFVAPAPPPDPER